MTDLTHVVLRRAADVPVFTARLNSLDLRWRVVDGLPRHLLVEADPKSFPLARDPAVECVDDAAGPVAEASQEIAVDGLLLDAPWALARIIRRSPPWNPDRLVFPFDTYYRSDRTGDGVDIYVLDGGFRTTHQEISGRAVNVYNFYTGSPDQSVTGHGTAVAACAGGNTLGTARESLLWSFKCLNNSGFGSTESVVAAAGQALLHYASRSGLNRPCVVNMSLQNFGSGVNAAVSDMIDAGMVVVVCVGNSKNDLGLTQQYPAESDPDVLAVGGSAMDDTPYFTTNFGTNFGTRVDVLAPSQNVRTTAPNGDSLYNQRSGTSFGCGYASGVMACRLQGQSRLSGRAAVLAAKAGLVAAATRGRFRQGFGLTPLPDALLYLDPNDRGPVRVFAVSSSTRNYTAPQLANSTPGVQSNNVYRVPNIARTTA